MYPFVSDSFFYCVSLHDTSPQMRGTSYCNLVLLPTCCVLLEPWCLVLPCFEAALQMPGKPSSLTSFPLLTLARITPFPLFQPAGRLHGPFSSLMRPLIPLPSQAVKHFFHVREEREQHDILRLFFFVEMASAALDAFFRGPWQSRYSPCPTLRQSKLRGVNPPPQYKYTKRDVPPRDTSRLRDPAFCPKGHLRLVLCCGSGAVFPDLCKAPLSAFIVMLL